MTATQVMKWLADQGTAQNRKIYARHGAREPMFGVSYANLEKIRKQIKVDQALAEELWASGNHDARVLATKIADPERCSAALLSRWLKDCDDRVLVGALTELAARSKSALALGSKWMQSRDEWAALAGWTVMSILAEQGAEGSGELWQNCVERIEREIHQSPNWVRYAMNNALIGIGVGRAEMTKDALAAARRIGPVQVDHGETGCKTPEAGAYILKTLEHRKKKAGGRKSL